MRLLLSLALLLPLAAGCKKKKPTPATEPAPVAEESSGGGNTNYVGGGGAVQNVRQAARRTDRLNDMGQLGKFMEMMYTENGKMPTKPEVIAYIQRDAAKIVQAINAGDIILTGTKDHGGLWAYEVDVDKMGGIVLVAGVAQRAQPDDAKKLLGK